MLLCDKSCQELRPLETEIILCHAMKYFQNGTQKTGAKSRMEKKQTKRTMSFNIPQHQNSARAKSGGIKYEHDILMLLSQTSRQN